MKRFWFALGATALLFIAGAVGGYVAYSRDADASRNSSGTMSAINGPYVSGTVINSATVNARLADIETEMTDSLDRSGKGGMLSALRGIDGTVAAPAYSWTSETGTGLYRIGAGDLGVAISGAKKLELTSSLFTVTPAASFSSTITGTGLIQSTVAGATSIKALSGASGSATDISLGRTASEARLGVSAGANNYAQGSAAGDIVLGTLGTKLWVDTNSGSGTPSLAVVAANGGVITNGGLTVNTGIGADGSGFKHKRGVSGCTTAAVAGATCSVTVTWGTAFADANYTATCNVNGSSGPVAYVGISGKIAASLSVAITAVTAVAATATTFECIAVHD